MLALLQPPPQRKLILQFPGLYFPHRRSSRNQRSRSHPLRRRQLMKESCFGAKRWLPDEATLRDPISIAPGNERNSGANLHSASNLYVLWGTGKSSIGHTQITFIGRTGWITTKPKDLKSVSINATVGAGAKSFLGCSVDKNGKEKYVEVLSLEARAREQEKGQYCAVSVPLRITLSRKGPLIRARHRIPSRLYERQNGCTT